MPDHILLGASSASSTIMDSKSDLSSENIFKWESIWTFVYLAATFSGSTTNFDLFSGEHVPVAHFIFYSVFLGIPYMFVEFFIKQYTGKVDFNESLNPLLKGVNYGILIQTGTWAIIHSFDLTETVLFLLESFQQMPAFVACHHKNHNIQPNEVCIDANNVSLFCKERQMKNLPTIELNFTSPHYYFRKLFSSASRSTFTQKLLILAIVWIINFCFCSLPEKIIAKVFKVAYNYRTFSTILVACHVFFSERGRIGQSLQDMLKMSDLDITANKQPLVHVMYVFGLGIVNVYDFGAMSPFTAVDTCVCVHALVFTVQSLLRSAIIKIMHSKAANCIKWSNKYYYYDLMVLYPLCTNFFKAAKLLLLYFYLYQVFTLIPQMAAVTFTSSKMLHTEFRQVKNTYMSGILSFVGFTSSLFSLTFEHQVWYGLHLALTNCMLLMAFLKMSIIAYLYGVGRFAVDVKFWLGFKPVAFWTVSWGLLPVLIYIGIIQQGNNLIDLFNNPDKTKPLTFELTWRIFIGFTLIIVTVVTLRTAGKYVAQSNFFSLFKASNSYGPPDAEERRQRRKYDEAITRRFCIHNCVPLDDRFACNHRPLQSQSTTDPAILNIFQAPSISSYKRKMSETVDVNLMLD